MFDSGENFRVSSSDLSHHVTVMKTINKRLPAGSKWVIEVGHNGNGNIEVSLLPINSNLGIVLLSTCRQPIQNMLREQAQPLAFVLQDPVSFPSPECLIPFHVPLLG